MNFELFSKSKIAAGKFSLKQVEFSIQRRLPCLAIFISLHLASANWIPDPNVGLF
jgi:hypothetical protein